MIKQFVLFLLLSFVLTSCCKKELHIQNLCAEPNIISNTCTSDSNQIKILILGKWNWTQSINSWTQAKTNPCTDSINYSYEFISNGTIKYFENGSYKYPGVYSFSPNQGISIQVFEDSAAYFRESGWVSICNNSLIIDDSPVDGPKDIFLRAE